MEIHLWQCVLVGLWTAFCITGMLTGTYLTRCLVMAAGVGVILGDVETGLAMGAVGELAFLGFGVSSGGSVPPNPVGPGIVGAVLAITAKGQGIDAEAALAYSFPFAILVQFLITCIYTIAAGFPEKAARAVDNGRWGKYCLLANGTILMFAGTGFVIGFAAAFHAQGLGQLIGAIPEWLTGGLTTAGKMLPAVGFAVILSVMCGWDTGAFVILGYSAAAYLDVPVLGIALISGAFAWMLGEQGAGRGTLGDAGAAGGSESVFGGSGGSGGSDGSGGSGDSDGFGGTGGSGGSGGSVGAGSSVPGVRPLSEKALRRLSRRCALRAYFLQNGYNYGNYEGLSYSWVVFPAIKKLFPGEKDMRRELKDSMSYCSVNPNFLPILTSLHLISLNRGLSSRDTRDIRTAMMGPLAGVGDSLIQFCVAPVFSTLGAGMAAQGSMAGPIVFLLGINAILLTLKLSNEALGFRLGASLAGQMEERLGTLSLGARRVGCAVIAGLAVNSVDMKTSLAVSGQEGALFSLQDFLDTLLPGALPVLCTVILYYLFKKKKWGMYRLVGLTMAAGAMLHWLGILA